MKEKEKYTKASQTKANADNHANQKNPNSQAYKKAQDNRANQLNPNNPKYQGRKGTIGNK